MPLFTITPQPSIDRESSSGPKQVTFLTVARLQTLPYPIFQLSPASVSITLLTRKNIFTNVFLLLRVSFLLFFYLFLKNACFDSFFPRFLLLRSVCCHFPIGFPTFPHSCMSFEYRNAMILHDSSLSKPFVPNVSDLDETTAMRQVTSKPIHMHRFFIIYSHLFFFSFSREIQLSIFILPYSPSYLLYWAPYCGADPHAFTILGEI